MSDIGGLNFDLAPAPFAPGGPNPRERGGGHHISHAGQPCKNCETVLQGEYCHVCGQPGHLHRTAFAVFEDFVHGIAHLDGRTWRTLPALVFQPGKLTRDYIEGKRARYVPPMALFLFMVFSMFIVFELSGGPVAINHPGTKQIEDQTGTHSDKIGKSAQARADLEQQIEAARKAGDQGKVRTGELALQGIDAFDHSEEPGPVGALKTFMKMKAASVRTGNSKLDAKLSHKLANPDLLFYKLQNTAYKFSFLLVPISVPFIWLIFAWRRGLRLYDHVVFSLYSLSFMSLLFIMVTLIKDVAPFIPIPWQVWAVAFLAPVVHIYAQLRGAYRLGRFSALWRTGYVTTIMAPLCLALFVSAIFLLGALG